MRVLDWNEADTTIIVRSICISCPDFQPQNRPLACFVAATVLFLESNARDHDADRDRLIIAALELCECLP